VFTYIQLVPFLSHCEIFGHSNVVVMPVDGYRKPVLQFFDRIDHLLRSAPYGLEQWRESLGQYVNRALAREAGKPRPAFERIAVWMYLRRSLGYVD
jgi:hypothetical protein